MERNFTKLSNSVFFKWLFAENGEVYIIVLGVGDCLTEPVGIMWGKHKYQTTACISTRAYSWEGSVCVFLSGMIFPALQYANFTQVLVSMLVLPPTMANAKAIAPDTMDTPVLMIDEHSNDTKSEENCVHMLMLRG
ncbi:Aste57867_2705 [Aphanomyces stellatus]|uniref:Aste57867_2705 protein n=1 Tax=Aphanomyces stellatus TaxID=120398 RepID=A0A485K989_9STRA|nr:hypothetical protein As57867_002698 [Aphanomyces stellatus]VFT79898.1 Aste57867_2705 [Aphanomyces stellatus]